jgi:hypothetical protein
MHALDSDDEELQPRLLHSKACGTWHSPQTHMHAKLTSVWPRGGTWGERERKVRRIQPHTDRLTVSLTCNTSANERSTSYSLTYRAVLVNNPPPPPPSPALAPPTTATSSAKRSMTTQFALTYKGPLFLASFPATTQVFIQTQSCPPDSSFQAQKHATFLSGHAALAPA